MHRDRGFQLFEIALAAAIAGGMMLALAPPLLDWSRGVRLRTAAAELVGVLRATRMQAIAQNVRVGVKFRLHDTGRVTFTLHRDGDGDGVRTVDIDDGTDPQLGIEQQLLQVGGDVRMGFPPGIVPRDPGSPSRRLDRLDDPVRFNRSDIASFSPLGESTPGSIYLTDSRRHLAAVRLYGRTGKVKVLVWQPEARRWRLD